MGKENTQVAIFHEAHAAFSPGMDRLPDGAERGQKPSLPECLEKPAFPGGMAFLGEEIVNDHQPPAGRNRPRRRGKELGRRGEMDEGLYGEGEVERGQARETRKVCRDERALSGEPADARLPARNTGLLRADCDADPRHGRVHCTGKEEQAASDTAADVQNPKLSLPRRAGPGPGFARNKPVHVIHRVLETLHPARPHGASNGECPPADPEGKKEPRVALIVLTDRGGGVRVCPFTTTGHALIVPGVAEWCKTMYPWGMASPGILPASTPRPRLAFILVTIFLDMAGFGMVVPLLPLYVQSHSGGALLAGALGSVYAVMQVIGAPMIGSFADRHGRRSVLVACLLGSFCAYLGIGLAGSIAALFAAVACGGLVGGSFATAQAYIADGSGPADRTRWLGLAGAAVGLGIAAGPLLGGLLGARGLRLPAFAASGVALGNAMYGFFVIRDFKPAGPASGPAAGDRPNLRFNPVVAILDVIRRPELRPFLLTLAALNLSFSGLPSTFPLFSQARFGWTPSANGLFFAFIGACAVLTQGFLVGRIAPRVGESRLASIGAAMAMVMFPFAALAPAAWMLYPILGLVAIGTGLGIPSLMSIIAHNAPEAGVGRVMGGVQSVLSACLIAGPGLAGAAHQVIGPPAPYWMGAGFAAAGFLIVSLSGRRGGKARA